VPRDHVAAVESHRDTIAHETLAVGVTVNPSPGAEVAVKVEAVEAGGYEA
jgi:isoleucyl-tRNA synthetase